MQQHRSGGDSQFARYDNREAFLRDKADELRALIPDLPLTIVDRRMAEVGQYDYDRQTLAVELSRYSVWIESNGPRLTADIPTTLPRSIVVPKGLARAIVERTVPGAAALPRDGYRLTVALRYMIRDVRVGKNEVLLDIAMLDDTLCADRNLTVPIMSIPLDEHSVLAPRPKRVADRNSSRVMAPQIVRAQGRRAEPEIVGAPSLHLLGEGNEIVGRGPTTHLLK